VKEVPDVVRSAVCAVVKNSPTNYFPDQVCLRRNPGIIKAAKMSISALPSNITQHLSSPSNLGARNRNMPSFALNNSSSTCPRPVLQMSVTLGAGPRWWS
jgi:hypothetical protein